MCARRPSCSHSPQAHNISARQIRDEADRRREAAAAEQARQNAEESAAAITSGRRTSSRQQRQQGQQQEQEEQQAAPRVTAAKKREAQKTMEKIKRSSAFKKRKRDLDGSDDDSDDIAQAIFDRRHAPLPGQMENCAVCDKRFTVTPYTVANPGGGLCCPPCGRVVAKEKQGQQPQKKKKKEPSRQAGGIGSRRAVQSRILDGDFGTKSLATLCVQKLAKNVDMAESLGDLPEHLVDKIARIFSKRRLLNPETLPLFVQNGTEMVHIYDGARLGVQDFIGIFQTSPRLKRFKARSAIQFKDEVMDFLLSRDAIKLESFYLNGANLLSEAKWHEFLCAQGENLRALQVYYTDRHFGNESINAVRGHCPNMKRLKIENNQKVTGQGVEAIAQISSLEHVGLQLQQQVLTREVLPMITSIGANLRTLSLKIMPKLDDRLLDAIHNSCRSLAKLRITDSEEMTDKGFAALFDGWANPPLEFADFQKCRLMDSHAPRDNAGGVGFCGEAFKALMAHSGRKLRHLNLHACRHIPREAFEEVFSEAAVFPELATLEISFCEEVTDHVLGCVFRACPRIKEVNVFGCMKVREVMVPRGVILVGVPNALGMITEGN